MTLYVFNLYHCITSTAFFWEDLWVHLYSVLFGLIILFLLLQLLTRIGLESIPLLNIVYLRMIDPTHYYDEMSANYSLNQGRISYDDELENEYFLINPTT